MPSRKRDIVRARRVPTPDHLRSDSTIEVLKRGQGGDHSAAHVLIERALPALRRWTRGRLPAYARRAIVFRVELGYSIDEIAKRLGKSKAAASMTVSDALLSH